MFEIFRLLRRLSGILLIGLTALSVLTFLSFTPTTAKADSRQNLNYNNYPSANPCWHSNLHKQGGRHGWGQGGIRHQQYKKNRHYYKHHQKNFTYITPYQRHQKYLRYEDVYGTHSYDNTPRHSTRSPYQLYYQGKNFIIIIR